MLRSGRVLAGCPTAFGPAFAPAAIERLAQGSPWPCQLVPDGDWDLPPGTARNDARAVTPVRGSADAPARHCATAPFDAAGEQTSRRMARVESARGELPLAMAAPGCTTSLAGASHASARIGAVGRQRPRLSFRAVNRMGQPQFDPGLQRHHLLPRQLLGQGGFAALFAAIGRDRVGFDDFRRNGMLLPACDTAALRLRMPMHRGPHQRYNAMVAERVGQVEREWARLRLRAPDAALSQAVMRLDLLQRALRRRLLAPDRPHLRLNRHDPLGSGLDFSTLDALADALWGGTEPAPTT